MKTDLFAINKLYDLLITQGIENQISGAVYKGDDRADSRLEDIVISCDENYNGDTQTVLINLSLYVPDKEITAGDTISHQANRERIEELSDRIISHIDGYYTSEMNIAVTSQITRKATGSKEHISLIYIILNMFNLNS